MKLKRLRSLSRQGSIASILIGCIVLMGWIAHIEPLKTIFPGLVTMKVNTAVGFILGGAALWWYHDPDTSKHRQLTRSLSQVCAIAIALLGLLALIEYSFKVNLGLNELLIRDISSQIQTATPGRMAIETALDFLMLGSALILFNRGLYGIGQSLAATSFLISFLALIGYCFQIKELYTLFPGTSMALHTCIAFVILALGILFTHPDQGWVGIVASPYLGGITVRRLLPLIIIVPLLLAGIFLFAHKHKILLMELGLAYDCILNILILGSVSLWNARFLNQLDVKRRQTKLALRELNEQLETKVNDRTAELAIVNQRLQENAQLLQSVIESISDPIYLKDAEGRYLLLNTASCQVIGLPEEAILGRNDRELLPLEVAEILMANDRAIIDNNETQIFEEKVPRDGVMRDFLSTKSAWRSEDGTFHGLVGFSRDITDAYGELRLRKQAEFALRQSEERLRLAIEGAGMGMTDVDLQTGKAIWSPRHFEMFGYDPIEDGEATLEMWRSRVHPDDLDRVMQVAEKSQRERSLYYTEHRISRADNGNLVWVSAYGRFLYNETGLATRFIGVLFDVSDRKRSEEALRQSEERLHSVLENMPVLLDGFDDKGNIIVWNQECERVTGYTAEETIDNPKALEYLYPDPNYRQQMIAAWNQRGNNYRNWEWDLIHKNGETRTIAWSNISDRFPVPGWASWGIGVDITERKQAELAIVQINQTLEERVQQRTAELTLANQELEAFSYSVSHDLRAPLRGIDGFSQVLHESYAEQLDEKGKHYLHRIRAGAARMGELIDDLLMLSRVTRADIQRVPVNLSAIAQAIAHNLSFTQSDRLVEWVIPSDIWTTCDTLLLRIVLENLLNNAWKFTSTQSQTRIELGIILTSDRPTPTYFIKDNGVGFNMAYSNKLFKAFQRLHLEREFPGTGIGLAIVQRIVQRHGGAVWAEANVNEGATLYFILD